MAVYSVIITARDQPDLLQRAIVSIKTQSFNSAQVIVLSDRPGGPVHEAVQPLLSGPDVFVQRFEPCGHAAARNTCLGFVAGKAYLFLDEGDAFTEDFFRALYPFLDPARAVYANYHTVVEEVQGGSSTPLCAWPKDLAALDLDAPESERVLPSHCTVYPAWLAGTLRFDETRASCTDWNYLLDARKHLTLAHAAVAGPIVYARTVPATIEPGTIEPGSATPLEQSLAAVSRRAAGLLIPA